MLLLCGLLVGIIALGQAVNTSWLCFAFAPASYFLLTLWYRLRICIVGDDVPWGPLTMEIGQYSGTRTFDLSDQNLNLELGSGTLTVVNKSTGERTSAWGVDGRSQGRSFISAARFDRFVADLDSALAERGGASISGVSVAERPEG